MSLETPKSLLLIDERKGRKMAKKLGLVVIGSLGILLKAKQLGVISSVSDVLKEIEKTDFRVSKKVKIEVLLQANEYTL